jgi:hypothetical protein
MQIKMLKQDHQQTLNQQDDWWKTSLYVHYFVGKIWWIVVHFKFTFSNSNPTVYIWSKTNCDGAHILVSTKFMMWKFDPK